MLYIEVSKSVKEVNILRLDHVLCRLVKICGYFIRFRVFDLLRLEPENVTNGCEKETPDLFLVLPFHHEHAHIRHIHVGYCCLGRIKLLLNLSESLLFLFL